MKHASLLLLLTFLFGLTACSKPADPTLMNYEQSLARADSLVQSWRCRQCPDSSFALRLAQ